MKILLLSGLVVASALPVAAQNRAQNGGAPFALPPSVTNMVALDAHNSLYVQTDDEDGNRVIPIPLRHSYAGGIARLFGGFVVPTLPFISPGNFGGAGVGGAGGGIGVTNVGGQAGMGGQGGGNGGFGAGGGVGNGIGLGGQIGGFGVGGTILASPRRRALRGGSR